MEKDADAFRTISEVAEDLELPQHVLRFWEMRFPQIKPLKRSGGRRYYRPQDVDLLRSIKRLLYEEGYTIKGVQRILKERGVRFVAGRNVEDRVEPSFVPSPDSDETDSSEPTADNPVDSEPSETLSARQRRILIAMLAEVEDCLRLLRSTTSQDAVSS